MTTLVILIAVVWLLLKLVMSSGGAAKEYNRLVADGTPGLGILLRVSPTGVRVPAGTTTSLESRSVLLDVEVPGQSPYEVNMVVTFPSSLKGDIVPGATVEVRVDPKNRTKLVIAGPGAGFAGTFAPRSS